MYNLKIHKQIKYKSFLYNDSIYRKKVKKSFINYIYITLLDFSIFFAKDIRNCSKCYGSNLLLQ